MPKSYEHGRGGAVADRSWRAAQWTIATNLLDHQFQPAAPNRKRVADFTDLWTAEGWLYVSVVLNLYSRRAVGWSMQLQTTTQRVPMRR